MRVRLEDFVLDTDSRQLLRNDRVRALSPKAFDVLALLVERRPAVVSKAELRDYAWSGAHVADGSLSVAVAELRTVLGDNARHPRYVRTVHRFGYAYCGRATPLSAQPSALRRKTTWHLIWDTDRVILPPGSSVLGRGANVDVSFDESDVSRRHARIVVSDTHATLEDLGSKNGTFVAGERISQPIRLAPGARFHLGPIAVRLRRVTNDGETTTSGGHADTSAST